jgi:hypothetical protein
MLDSSMGDEGTLSRRGGDCPLQGAGGATHLHTVRSREKLAAVPLLHLRAQRRERQPER